jgi:hypothetical protein
VAAAGGIGKRTKARPSGVVVELVQGIRQVAVRPCGEVGSRESAHETSSCRSQRQVGHFCHTASTGAPAARPSCRRTVLVEDLIPEGTAMNSTITISRTTRRLGVVVMLAAVSATGACRADSDTRALAHDSSALAHDTRPTGGPASSARQLPPTCGEKRQARAWDAGRPVPPPRVELNW